MLTTIIVLASILNITIGLLGLYYAHQTLAWRMKSDPAAPLKAKAQSWFSKIKMFCNPQVA